MEAILNYKIEMSASERWHHFAKGPTVAEWAFSTSLSAQLRPSYHFSAAEADTVGLWAYSELEHRR
jgi:hypothetical protein